MAKKNIKVKDLKPRKDAKGGGGGVKTVGGAPQPFGGGATNVGVGTDKNPSEGGANSGANSGALGGALGGAQH